MDCTGLYFLAHGDAVAAGVLAALEEVFEAADEHLHSVEGVDGGGTAGDGGYEVFGADMDIGTFHEGATTLGDVGEVFDGGAGNEDEEFVDGPAAEDIGVADGVGKGEGDGAKDLVTHGVAVVFVDDAQVVDVGEDGTEGKAMLAKFL